MTSLVDKAILSGAGNRLPMLEKDMYDSWKSIMELYMLNRQHGRMILESIENGLLLWLTVEENGVTRPKKYSELSATEEIQADCDVKAINIILQGLHQRSMHWKCKLYDEFDKFAYKKRESLRDFYLRFSLLLNDMNIYNMKLEQFQVNTKFLNTLPPEWSKFMTDVKLVRDLHTTNVDQLHAFLGQHEYHANKYASQAPSSTPLLISYPANDFQSSVNHNVYNPSSSIPQVEYAPAVHQQSDFSQPDIGLVVPVFQKGDDLIDAINHMMSFLTVVVTSRYPPTNNQLRTLSNPHQQAIINNGRGNRGSLFVTTIRAKATCLSNAQSLRGKEMRHGLRIRSRDSKDSKHTIALMANLSHYGFDNLAETTVQNSSSPAQQDDLILSVIEQLKTQVVNCTKINQDNKNVNEILTVELERYKNHVRILKEQNNIDKASESCAQSLEIDNLKQILSEHLKEKESLEQKVTLLKNDFQKEESRNIDRELALEKQKKRLKSLSGNVKEEKIKRELEEIEMINSELDHRVTKLVAENEHLKQTYKQLYDSIKSSRVRSKE
nr:hypothetical protein [Tanacetum cinerariifolium]